MRTAKSHPQLGWLRLQPRDYSRSLDHLLNFRDRDPDPSRTGPSPDYITWMWSVELPELMRKQGYRDQIAAHCAELAHRSDAIGADIHKMVGSKLEEQTAADELRAQLTALLDE